MISKYEEKLLIHKATNTLKTSLGYVLNMFYIDAFAFYYFHQNLKTETLAFPCFTGFLIEKKSS